MKNFTLLLSLFLVGCFGHKVSGGTKNTVTTEGTTEVVLKIDISGCMDFADEEAKLECIKALTQTFEEVGKTYQTVLCYQKNKDNPEVCLPKAALLGDVE